MKTAKYKNEINNQWKKNNENNKIEAKKVKLIALLKSTSCDVAGLSGNHAPITTCDYFKFWLLDYVSLQNMYSWHCKTLYEIYINV